MLGAHDLRAGVGLDTAGLAVDHLAPALQDLDLVPLQQDADAAGQAADDAILPLHGACQVDGRPLDRDAERRAARLLDGVMEGLCGMDQRLGGDAADIEARPAQAAVAATLLDQHGVEAELAGADRRYVAAGTAAQHQQLGIYVGHLTPL